MGRQRRKSPAERRREALQSMPPATAQPPHSPLRLRGRFTYDELRPRLTNLKKRHARRQTFHKVWTILLVMVLLFGSMGAMGVFLVKYTGIAIASLILGPIVAVIVLSRRLTSTPPDYDQRQAQAVLGLTEMLEPELAKGSSFEIDLDLRGYDRTWGKVLERTRMGLNSVRLYRRRWLTLSFRLLDGTQVTLRAELMAKRKKRITSKRVKLKDRIQETVVVSIRPKGSGTPPADAPARAAALAEPVTALRLRGAKRRPRSIDFTFQGGTATRNNPRGVWRVQSQSRLLQGQRLLMAVLIAFRAGAPRSAGGATDPS